MEDDGEGERVLQNHSGEEEALLSWGEGRRDNCLQRAPKGHPIQTAHPEGQEGA